MKLILNIMTVLENKMKCPFHINEEEEEFWRKTTGMCLYCGMEFKNELVTNITE